jgi:CheY-like chemotaxis protein
MAKNGGLIVVVDDDQDIREIMKLVLEAEGYSVETAADGASAWKQITGSRRPSLILLDLIMPGMDGKSFVHMLRSGPFASVPIVIVSGKKMDHDEVAATEADEVLIKPVEFDQLLQVVRRLAPQQRDL